MRTPVVFSRFRWPPKLCECERSKELLGQTYVSNAALCGGRIMSTSAKHQRFENMSSTGVILSAPPPLHPVFGDRAGASAGRKAFEFGTPCRTGPRPIIAPAAASPRGCHGSPRASSSDHHTIRFPHDPAVLPHREIESALLPLSPRGSPTAPKAGQHLTRMSTLRRSTRLHDGRA